MALFFWGLIDTKQTKIKSSRVFAEVFTESANQFFPQIEEQHLVLWKLVQIQTKVDPKNPPQPSPPSEDTASSSPDDEDPSGPVPVDCQAEEALGALLAAQVFGPVAQCTAA